MASEVTGGVRPSPIHEKAPSGGSLNIEELVPLEEYLAAKGWVSQTGKVFCEPLPGGVSNRTVLVRFPSGDAWVIKQALPKLRVAVDWFSHPARVHREARGLQILAQLAPADSVPRFIFEDPDQNLLAMSAVPQPFDNWKALLLRGEVAPGLVRQFGEWLGTVHRRSREHTAELSRTFGDRTFFESLRIEPYYWYTAEQVPEAADFIRNLIAPANGIRPALVHGDYSPKNVLVRHGRIVVLDFEVIHWGDPAFDLGFSLTHFLSKALHLPNHRAALITAIHSYWGAYQTALEEVDPLLESRAIRHALACLLARVAGRSPLEYLSVAEQVRQRQIVCRLMQHPPNHLPELTAAWQTALNETTD